MTAKRFSGLDYCGCKDEQGVPRYYDTCPLHGEPPYDRGFRAGQHSVYEAIIPTAIVAGLLGLGEFAREQAGRATGATIIFFSVIVLLVTLVAQASASRPRYRR